MATTIQDDLGADAPVDKVRRRRPIEILRSASADQLTVLFVVIAITLTAVVVLCTRWTPVGDNALIELKVRDVPSHLPLTGVYSRFGWSHPGPLQFWLLSVPYAVFRSSASLLFGALLAQLVAVVVAWWLARRISRTAGWTVLIALMAVMATVPGEVVRSPWNPYIALAAAGTVLVAAWAVAERMAWGAIWLAVVGSYLVQGHVVTLPLVAMLVIVAFALALWPHRGSGDVDRAPVPWRSYEWAGGIAAVLWAGPIIDQLVSDSPNASILAMGSGDGPRVGIANALGLLSQSFAVVPNWLHPSTAVARDLDQRWTVPFWLVVPIAGLVIAVVRRDSKFVRGSIVAAAALVAVVAKNTLVSHGLFGYLTIADRGVAALALAIGFASLARHLPSTWRRPLTRPLTIGASALVCALAVAVGVNVLRTPNPGTYEAAEVETFASDVEARHATDERLVVQFAFLDYSRRVSVGLIDQLERDGYEVRLRGGAEILVGRHRITDTGWGDTDLMVFSVLDPDADELAAQGWTVIGTYEGSETLHLASRDGDAS